MKRRRPFVALALTLCVLAACVVSACAKASPSTPVAAGPPTTYGSAATTPDPNAPVTTLSPLTAPSTSDPLFLATTATTTTTTAPLSPLCGTAVELNKVGKVVSAEGPDIANDAADLTILGQLLQTIGTEGQPPLSGVAQRLSRTMAEMLVDMSRPGADKLAIYHRVTAQNNDWVTILFRLAQACPHFAD